MNKVKFELCPDTNKIKGVKFYPNFEINKTIEDLNNKILKHSFERNCAEIELQNIYNIREIAADILKLIEEKIGYDLWVFPADMVPYLKEKYKVEEIKKNEKE